MDKVITHMRIDHKRYLWEFYHHRICPVSIRWSKLTSDLKAMLKDEVNLRQAFLQLPLSIQTRSLHAANRPKAQAQQRALQASIDIPFMKSLKQWRNFKFIKSTKCTVTLQVLNGHNHKYRLVKVKHHDTYKWRTTDSYHIFVLDREHAIYNACQSSISEIHLIYLIIKFAS